MKAWLLESLGGVDQLRLGEHPDPIPGDHEVVVDVRYAALNPADRYLAEGQYPARPIFPHILGRDGLGVVSRVGPGVTRWNEGDRALILRSEVGVTRAGTFAEKVAVPVASLAPVPEDWSEPQSAGAALVYLTAYQALTQWGSLPPRSNILITGASGGVGVASIQLAAALGHNVVSLSRGTAKRDALKKLGSAAVFDPNDAKWRQRVKDFLANKTHAKVDLAIDNIGGALFGDLLDTLGNFGRVSVVGRLAGPVPQFNTASLLFRRIRIGGVFVGGYTPEESQQAWHAALELMSRTGAKPIVDRVFGFDQLRAAFDRLAEGPLGKVVLAVSGPA
jgi:NADPH:quinone reductase